MFEANHLFAQRYLLVEKAGSGQFSEVWKAVDQMADQSVVTLKIYAPQHGLDDRGLRRFRREYAAILDLSHPNLLMPRHFDDWETQPYLILPYMEKGSLGTLLARNGTVSERDLAEMLLQISNALAYLHARDVLHQRITPANILIGQDGEYLLSDYGLSDRFRSMLRKSMPSNQNRDLAYNPPESIDVTAGAHPAGDIFSLGLVAIELATGELPWDASDVMKSEADIPSMPESYSADLRQWIAAMMSREPGNRPAAQQVASAAEKYLQKGTWSEGPDHPEDSAQTSTFEEEASKKVPDGNREASPGRKENPSDFGSVSLEVPVSESRKDHIEAPETYSEKDRSKTGGPFSSQFEADQREQEQGSNRSGFNDEVAGLEVEAKKKNWIDYTVWTVMLIVVTVGIILQIVSHLGNRGSLHFTVVPGNATVRMLDESGRTVKQWEGLNELRRLKEGNYMLLVEATGYQSDERSIRIRSDARLLVNVELQNRVEQSFKNIEGAREQEKNGQYLPVIPNDSQFEDFATPFQKSEDTFRNEIIALEEIANAHLSTGRIDEALGVVKELIELDLENLQYRLIYANLVYQMVQNLDDQVRKMHDQIYDVSREIRQKARQPGFDQQEIQRMTAEMEQKQARANELIEESFRFSEMAKNELLVAVESDPNNADVHANLGIIFQNRGALMQDKRNMTEDMEEAEMFDRQAREYLQKSIPHYEKAAELQPENTDHWLSLFRIYTNLGMAEEARRTQKRAGL